MHFSSSKLTLNVPLWPLDVPCKKFDIILKFLSSRAIHIKQKNSCKNYDITIYSRHKYACKTSDILIHVKHQIATVNIWKSPRKYPCKNMKKSKYECKIVDPFLLMRY